MNWFKNIWIPRIPKPRFPGQIKLDEKKVWIISVVAGTATCGFLYALESYADASEFVVHPYKLPWSHRGVIDSLDAKSVRRGYEVYKQVCAACHAAKYVRYRHFIDTFMTEEEAKAEAAEALIDDLDENGQIYKRPGLLNDFLPSPYPDKKAAAAANNGAAPPDLSMMSQARHDADNYIYHLLTGYGFDVPEGVLVEEGKAYNPYFPNGSVLAMPQQLFDDGIEYKDGTPATMSQQAKDVTTFLRWASESFHDDRKKYFIKIALVLPIIVFVLLYQKRHVWSTIKSEKVFHRTIKGREWTPNSPHPQPPKEAPSIKKVN